MAAVDADDVTCTVFNEQALLPMQQKGNSGEIPHATNLRE
jgi:hypothetical protein